MIRVDRVGDGPLVLTDPVPGARSVAVGAWIGVGSRDEEPAQAGVCHFLEHLLFKGTTELTALELARTVERSGGDLDAFTSREHTVLHARFPARHADLAIDLLGGVLSAPALRAEDVEVERDVILEELAATRDVPEEEAYLALYGALFPDHGLGRDALGTDDTIAALERDDIADFFAAEFRSDRMVIVASGAADHDQIVDRLSSALRVEPATTPLRRTPVQAVTGAELELRRPCEQSQLVLAWPGLAAVDDDRHAHAVLVQLLGGGMSSRLFQRVREERGWAYSVYASSASFTDAGVLLVAASTAPGRLDAATELILAEVDELCRRGPDDDELETAVGALAGSVELAAEDASARMYGHGLALTERGEPMDVDADVARLLSVTAGDVAAMASRLLDAAPTRVAVRPG